MAKRKASTASSDPKEVTIAAKKGKSTRAKKKEGTSVEDRCDPASRGVHHDALQFGTAPTSGATCVDCGKIITKGSVRWGVKYAGNPLPVPVIPLYGSHPMVMWCHANCGLTYCKLLPDSACVAATTCHLCQDKPDLKKDDGLRLLCGGSNKGRKIRAHAFHLSCWRQAVLRCENGSVREAILKQPISNIGNGNGRGLGWDDLLAEQQKTVQNELT